MCVPALSADRGVCVCVCAVLVLHCVWQLESVERGVYLIGSAFFTSSCSRTRHKDRQEMCSGTSSCVLSFTLSLTEIRTAESLRQHLCVFFPPEVVMISREHRFEKLESINIRVVILMTLIYVKKGN